MPKEYAEARREALEREAFEEILKAAERRGDLKRSLRRWKIAACLLLILLTLAEGVIVIQGRRLAVCQGQPIEMSR